MKSLAYRFLLALSMVCAAGTGGAQTRWSGGPGYRTYVIGDEARATTAPVRGGLLLSGGGDWAYEAFRWFNERAGHGHVVILRASGSDDLQREMYQQVGGLASVRTFVFSARRAAYDARVLAALHDADGIFLAGGDQSNYVRMWRGTPLNAALEAHVRAGKPLGGTSAGLAVQGEWLYGAMDGGSITSPEALADPLGKAVTIEGQFLHTPLLAGIVTDSHFDTRARLGRLIAFIAKAQVLAGRALTGLGVDEQATLTVEDDGTTRLYSNDDGHAWLVQDVHPSVLAAGRPLSVAAVRVTGIDARSRFSLRTRAVERPAFQRTYDIAEGRMQQRMDWSLAVHGGAGVIERGALTPEKEALYRRGLQAALAAGRAVLERGGKALDAVQATVVVLEDDPLFNAGRGAAIAADDKVYLDAAIMDGAGQRAGAVAAVTRTRNPVKLARAVMDKTRHVLLAGEGADRFSVEQGLEQVDPAYFRTPERERMLQEWRQGQVARVDRTHLYGTVGAVALDADGHLAAATSTGGLTGKRWGRIGDSPLIGAGTYAADGLCAVSATGTGEFFIRDSAARQVCDRVRWQGVDIDRAARETILSVGSIGGDGGLIAMDAQGRVSFAINDLGMYRGVIAPGAPPRTAIYADEILP